MPVSFEEANKMYNSTIQTAYIFFGVDLHGLGWKFTTNRRKRAIGICNYTKKTIEISEHYLSVNNVDQIFDTIAHEIAHALAGSAANHGAQWKRVHKALGGSGKANATAGVDSNSIKATYHVINTLNGKVVAEYFRKPSRDFSLCTVNGDPSTLGKLKLVKV